MWEFDSIFAKTKTYFERAAEHGHSDDDEFVIWHLLGFEFLLRSPLARIHPSLLAAPEGDAMLHANGVPTTTEPKSLPSHSVIARLAQIVPNFTKERQQDSTILINLRNAELHTGAAAVGNIGNDFWLPKLIRVAEVICEHLGVDLEDVLEVDVVELGRSLVDLEDKKLQHEVSKRIADAKTFASMLTPDEIESRLGSSGFASPWQANKVKCPGCEKDVKITTERMRASGERFVNDSLVRDVIYVATRFKCPICNLEFGSTAEIVAAELPQQFTEEEWEDLAERFQEQYVDDDYGND